MKNLTAALMATTAVFFICVGCSVQKKQAARTVLQGVADGLNAYARTADPHIAWCDNHGGFIDRAYENETVGVTLDNGQTGVGTIQHVYIVCTDGTRIKER